MPNYFTHMTFGAMVLRALPEGLRSGLVGARAAFDLGCLGPDPLFFYHPAVPNPVRREGLEMHRRSALPAFRRLAAAVAEGLPWAEGYAAGFLCHFALDGACHPYVEERARAGGITHLAIEAEFDRLLMAGAGLDTGRHHLPPPPDGAVWTAMSAAYAHVSPAQAEHAYRAMRRDTALLARTCGRGLGRVVDAAALLPPCRGMRGIALRARPAPGSVETSARLRALMEGAAEETAAQLAAFLEAAAHGGALSPWLDRDFSGRRCGDMRTECRTA